MPPASAAARPATEDRSPAVLLRRLTLVRLAPVLAALGVLAGAMGVVSAFLALDGPLGSVCGAAGVTGVASGVGAKEEVPAVPSWGLGAATGGASGVVGASSDALLGGDTFFGGDRGLSGRVGVLAAGDAPAAAASFSFRAFSRAAKAPTFFFFPELLGGVAAGELAGFFSNIALR